MNKKLLLGTLIFSLSINVHSRDLPNADIDGSSDCEDTVYASLQELRHAYKKQPESVATPEQQKSVTREPAEPKPTTSLTAELEAKKQELEEANRQRTTLSNQLLKINESIKNLNCIKKSPVIDASICILFGTAIAAAAEYLVLESKLKVPTGATFSALELATIFYTYYSNQEVNSYNQKLQTDLEISVLFRCNTAFSYANAVSESQRLQEEIKRLEQELAQ